MTWRRKWQPAPLFLPEKSHGQRNMVGYSPWSHKELDTTERLIHTQIVWGFPGGASGKEPACQCRRWKTCGFNPWVGKIPWRRESQPTPVFLPGESHGQRTLAGYSPWGHKELDTTEHKHAQTPGYLFYNMGYNPILLYFVAYDILALATGNSFN